MGSTTFDRAVLKAYADEVARLRTALGEIAKPSVGAASDWTLEECERYWFNQTRRCRDLAKSALEPRP